MTINIIHLLKGRIKMKGAMRLFSEYTMVSSKGIAGRYGSSQATASGYHAGDKFYFVLEIESKGSRDRFQSSELSELLDEMKAYAPASEWTLVKMEGQAT